jgi:cold shock protein
MTIGTVRWFDARKGHGFLKPDDGGADVLVTICAVERAGMASLDQGQRLSYEVVRNERIGRSCAENLSASGLQALPNRQGWRLEALGPAPPSPTLTP